MDTSTRKIDFTCNTHSPSEPFVHFWEHCVGSCHAPMALRADWQQQLSRCHKELGFKYVRFHGLLSDDMGTLVSEKDKPIYSFFNIDQIFDFLLSIGMRPFVELSFMPTALSSGTDTIFHYQANINPPLDYNEWGNLIGKLAAHLALRYGVAELSKWFFEVWNEPNLDIFWKGGQAGYFRLYEHTVKAIKEVNNDFKVGGPATAANEWITEFIEFCKKNHLPLDFISTHHYPNDAFGKPEDDVIAQLAAGRRSVLREKAQGAKAQAKDLPLYYTEWGTSSHPFDPLHDHPYAAAFIVKTVMEAHGIVEGYSYWTFSDIFEENYFSSIPFHGGFGLLNIHGIPKPAYRAFELLHGLGDEWLPVKGKHATVDVWVTKGNGFINLLLTNWALPLHPVEKETVRIKLYPISTVTTAYIERIDETHGNATKAWEEMGEPDMLTPDEVRALEKVSLLKKEPIPVIINGDLIIIEVILSPQSTAKITLETNGATR